MFADIHNFVDQVSGHKLLEGPGFLATYQPFHATKEAPVPSYDYNLQHSGAVPEPQWCVPNIGGKVCSTGGLFKKLAKGKGITSGTYLEAVAEATRVSKAGIKVFPDELDPVLDAPDAASDGDGMPEVADS